jgi:hypothetical protein
VISASVLYGLWLGGRARGKPIANPYPDVAVVGCALGGLMLTVFSGGIPLTWLRASQYEPLPSAPALLTDAAVWTLAGLCGCLAVRVLTPSLSERRARPRSPWPPWRAPRR